MHNLSIELRTILKKTCSLSSLTLHSHTKSSNENTIKYLFKTNDGNFIESVSMIDDNDRHTICVSSQSGCNLGCDFCATAKMGLMKNLTAGEIIDQLIIIRNLSKKPINNVVYMGMGEPFLNYENVIQSANILNLSLIHI